MLLGSLEMDLSPLNLASQWELSGDLCLSERTCNPILPQASLRAMNTQRAMRRVLKLQGILHIAS